MGGEWVWDIGTLEVGETQICEIRVTVIPQDFAIVVNEAVAAGAEFDPEPENNEGLASFEVIGAALLFADDFESGDLTGWN